MPHFLLSAYHRTGSSWPCYLFDDEDIALDALREAATTPGQSGVVSYVINVFEGGVSVRTVELQRTPTGRVWSECWSERQRSPIGPEAICYGRVCLPPSVLASPGQHDIEGVPV